MVASILLTILNLILTLWGVRTTRKNLRLAQDEFLKKWTPKLHAGVIQHAAYANALEITNLGQIALTISAIIMRRASTKNAPLQESRLDRVLQIGVSETI